MYQIDKIVKDKMIDGVKHYLIKWSGYSNKENTWEPYTTITDKKLIQKYERKKKGKSSEYQDLSTYIYLTSTTITSHPYLD